MVRNLAILCAFALATTTFALNGVVETIDGRKFAGEVELAAGSLTVRGAGQEPVIVAVSNLARAQFVENRPPRQQGGTGTGLVGVYYDSVNFSGRAFVRLDEAVNFEWPHGPMLGIPRDFFSVRWMGYLEPPTTDEYRLYIATDDGARLWIDGKLIANSWGQQGYTDTNVALRLVAGNKYELKLEYADMLGPARARLSWSSSSWPRTVIARDRLYPGSVDPERIVDLSGGDGLLATYYNDDNFGGATRSRIEPEIDVEWNGTGPTPSLPGIHTNRFSARWMGQLHVTNTALYTFHIDAGQPVRFYVNDRMMNDPWVERIEQVVPLELRVGEQYDVRLDTRTTNGSGYLKFAWSVASAPKEIVPRHRLSPRHALPDSPSREPELQIPTGVALMNGTIISAPIRMASDSAIRFQGLFAEQPVSVSKVARIHVKAPSPELLAGLPRGRTGVLLGNHDFVDGDFIGIENGRVKISSVLFGHRSFDLAKEVVVIAFRDLPATAWEFAVTARDGTSLYGKSLVLAPSRVGVDSTSVFTIPPAELADIVRAERPSRIAVVR